MKKWLKVLSVMALTVTCLFYSSTTILAAETQSNKLNYSVDESGDIYVDDLEAYLDLLNSGELAPSKNSYIIEGKALSLNGLVSDPSSDCSNILGHKWGAWGSWEVSNTISYSSGVTLHVIQRYRYCERKHCSAWQKEVDSVYVNP